jgi:hypothetical protein
VTYVFDLSSSKSRCLFQSVGTQQYKYRIQYVTIKKIL